MKLYYSPGSCSLGTHIVLREANIVPDLVKVDLWKKVTEQGDDFHTINPKAAVPTLQLDDGTILTEGAAILQYLGDHHVPDLVPPAGTIERTRLHEILNYLSSEYHKSWNPLFFLAPDADRTAAQQPVIARQTYLNGLLSDGRAYLLGDRFSVADTYLFAVTRWSGNFGIAVEQRPALAALMARIEARPAAQAALRAEGLENLYTAA